MALRSLLLLLIISGIHAEDVAAETTENPVPGDPDAVVLRSVDSSNLSLTWSNPESSPAEIVSYSIHWNSNSENVIYTEGDAPYTFPISELDPGTEYEVTIKSVGEAGSSPGVSRTASTYPESPANVWIKSENASGLEIEWDEAVEGVDAYNVLVQRADFSLSKTLNATSAFLTLPVLGGSYNVSIFTEFNNLTSEYPATVSARTVPPPPGNISCTPHNATSLMISLQTPEGEFEAEQFRVTYSIQEDDDVDEIEGDLTEPVQVVLASLVPGTEYDIEGFLVIDNLTSEAVATQCSTLLDAATLLSLSDVNETSLNASWENPEGSYDALELWCQGSSPGALGDLVTIPRDGPTHAVCSGLTSGALFEASVNTTQTNQSSVQSNNKWVATAPLLPTAFNVAGSSSDALNLTFNYDHGSDVSQCSFYIVNVSSSVYTIPCSDTELLIPRLGSNWLHDVQLTVMSNYSEGVSSVSEEGIIQGWTLPSNRLNPNITDIESRQFSVAWISPENPQNVAAYHLYVMNVTNDCLLFISLSANESMDEIVPLRNCDGELSEIFDPGNLTYLVGGLTPYEQYSVRISAVNPGGVGTEAATELTFTDEDTPGCVDLQSAEFDAGFDSIGIEWNPPNQPNGIITKYTIVYQMEGGNETLSNETDTNEIVIHELRPFTSYEFTVLAHTRIGEGEICDQSSSTQDTKIGVPHPAVNVQAIAIDAHSIEVSWDMEHDVSTGPITYFTVTAMEHDSSFEEVVQLEGFHKRKAVVRGLNAFRDYTVEVVTFVYNETNGTYSTPGKDAAEAMTLPSPSGPVNFFRVESIQGECYHMLAEWSDPIGYNRTGQVERYQVSWIEDGETKKEYFLPSVNFRGHIDPLDPNDVEYEFKMRVENEDVNELGEPFTSNTESTGRCGPIPPSDEGVGVITPTQSEFKSKSKIVIQVDVSFIDDSRNGALDLQGIIIGDAADNLIDEMLEISHEQLNVTFHPWSVAIKESPVRVFRATPDDWHPTSLLQSGSNYEVTIGDDESCDRNNAEVYCNGPLNSGRTYKRVKRCSDS
ncbi:hypothetical protein CAPTEDRAFT_210629 [Capitella teleta]|uniref:Fibronectin type-III domain-containing protein n=1 Tax=Capitella teleta TaxID=283909 RepID=R7UYF2_CAPTE|nr:hypothetical protein CAPTEDRAFT_210629 [Capitella teleta]|eukprot:ELU11344.1 hypothetical protein CAPTEDRAFT_210629 [Capitella teleta]